MHRVKLTQNRAEMTKYNPLLITIFVLERNVPVFKSKIVQKAKISIEAQNGHMLTPNWPPNDQKCPKIGKKDKRDQVCPFLVINIRSVAKHASFRPKMVMSSNFHKQKTSNILIKKMAQNCLNQLRIGQKGSKWPGIPPFCHKYLFGGQIYQVTGMNWS